MASLLNKKNPACAGFFFSRLGLRRIQRRTTLPFTTRT